MTPADHNKAIGIMHLIYGGFFSLMTLMMLIMFGFFAAILNSIPEEPGAPPMAFISVFMGLFVVLYAVLSIPSLVAGYALLKKKTWARTAAIVASVLAGLSFPFGTALCVYSLWFFFGEQGRDYEARQAAAGAGEWRGALHQGAASPGWGAQQEREAEARQHAYQPPPAPPDWRG